MAFVLEALILASIVLVVIFVVRPCLASRSRRLQLREERLAKLEAAKSAEEVTEVLMLDKELSENVRSHLNDAHERGEL